MSKTPPSELCPKSEDWDKLGIPHLTQMFLIKCYCTKQNATVTAFTTSELLRENQQGWIKIPRTQIRIKLTNTEYLPECISFKIRIDDKSFECICRLNPQVRPITDLNPS